MSGNCKKADSSGIQWHLLDDGLGRTGKASGMKIEYSMSDEIDFAQKLSIIMRKQYMRQLLEAENEMYHQELVSIGLLHSNDTVSEELRKCSQKLTKRGPKYINKALACNLTKLFKMYEC